MIPSFRIFSLLICHLPCFVTKKPPNAKPKTQRSRCFGGVPVPNCTGVRPCVPSPMLQREQHVDVVCEVQAATTQAELTAALAHNAFVFVFAMHTDSHLSAVCEVDLQDVAADHDVHVVGLDARISVSETGSLSCTVTPRLSAEPLAVGDTFVQRYTVYYTTGGKVVLWFCLALAFASAAVCVGLVVYAVKSYCNSKRPRRAANNAPAQPVGTPAFRLESLANAKPVLHIDQPNISYHA